MYDPAIGRWHVIDPIAELYNSLSPYHYALNNPIRYTDVLGMGADEFNDEDHNFDFPEFDSPEEENDWWTRYMEEKSAWDPNKTTTIAGENTQNPPPEKESENSENDKKTNTAAGMSIDITAAIGSAGYTIEIGSFVDETGKSYDFISYGRAMGGELSVSNNVFVIKSTDGTIFTGDEIEGTTYTFTVNAGFVSFSGSGDGKANYPEDDFAKAYAIAKTGGGFGIGVSTAKTKTIIRPSPSMTNINWCGRIRR
ncbi:MAG: hypothetical protein K9H49_14745 [Bacteroidales bacterium]|nr:hypothetical protein [Bacteroidales bacterium]MCF8390559.1 hypothetical protein [Bacteroidales bacterium]